MSLGLVLLIHVLPVHNTPNLLGLIPQRLLDWLWAIYLAPKRLCSTPTQILHVVFFDKVSLRYQVLDQSSWISHFEILSTTDVQAFLARD
jgi:hypothetical protein